MLSLFRRGITAKIMLGILGLVLFAVVITGFGTGGGGLGDVGGLGATNVASVGGTKITSQELTDETNRQFERLRQERPELDMGSFLSRGSLDEVLDQLISIAASVGFAKEQGLAASRKQVDREIASIPAFQGLTGQFDQATFQRVLQQERLTEAQLRREIETRLIQRQLLLPAAGSAFVPQGLAHQYGSLLLESRSGIVGAVPTQAMGPGREPTEQEIANQYRQNITRYTIPERRVVRYAAFGAEQVAAAAKASDAEIQAAYSRNPAYAAKESRVLSQVILPSEAAARALVAKIGGGMSFAQAAAQAGFAASDIALGEQTKEAYTRTASAPVANAVFAAAKGAVAGPVRSEYGWHVVRVDDVKTTAARPLAAVRSEIVAQVEAQKAQGAVQELAAKIEDQIADGRTFAEIVAAQKLQVVETAPITATGVSPENPAYRAPPEVAPLLEGAFAMEENEDPAVETIKANERFALVMVPRIVAAAPPPLAQIRDRVKTDLVIRNASERARAVATSIMSKINAGTPPAQAFAQAQVRLPAPQPINATRRDIAREGAQVPPPLTLLFNLPKGKARMVAAPDGRGWFIVYLAQITPGDARTQPGLSDAVRTQFAQILGDEYAAQFTAATRARAKIKRNPEAVQKTRQQLQSGGQQAQ
jgi:peptidyl-prolyl cis-trans isomerase D